MTKNVFLKHRRGDGSVRGGLQRGLTARGRALGCSIIHDITDRVRRGEAYRSTLRATMVFSISLVPS